MSPIVERLFALMGERKIKPVKVTRELNISQSSFTDWKNGRASPGVETLQKMSRYFGVSLDYLITGKEHSSSGVEQSELPFANPTDMEFIGKYQQLTEDCKEKADIFIDGMLAASQPGQTARRQPQFNGAGIAAP